MAGNGLIWLRTVGNDWKLQQKIPEMAGNSWKYLEIAGNGWKWLEMAVFVQLCTCPCFIPWCSCFVPWCPYFIQGFPCLVPGCTCFVPCCKCFVLAHLCLRAFREEHLKVKQNINKLKHFQTCRRKCGDTDFSDVTLVVEDRQHMDLDAVILSARNNKVLGMDREEL